MTLGKNGKWGVVKGEKEQRRKRNRGRKKVGIPPLETMEPRPPEVVYMENPKDLICLIDKLTPTKLK